MDQRTKLKLPTVSVDGKSYSVDNTNEYQKVILYTIGQQLDMMERFQRQNAPQEVLLKQRGVVEHYMLKLKAYDGVEFVPHLLMEDPKHG